ncbi:hypothetical protein GDO81_013768 [Engystomops pustulosus]|uniref:Uncharacterized protein n=1 Tax=Engystomops pustulosus TaxID=76066 RepID=A0AAV7B5G0_ENGPU|nr:hypothetical protein GDO81_013768 [Engystomops pustulosus]
MRKHILSGCITVLVLCLSVRGSIIFWVNTTSSFQTYSFDYCDVVDCKSGGTTTNYWFDTYVKGQYYLCVTRPGNENCRYWSDVGWNTGKNWGYVPQEARDRRDKQGKSLLTRLTLSTGQLKFSGCNCQANCLPLYLNLENPQVGDLRKYVLGCHVGSLNPEVGHIYLRDVREHPVAKPEAHPTTAAEGSLQRVVGEAIPIPGLSWEQVFSIETGTAPRKNLWLE